MLCSLRCLSVYCIAYMLAGVFPVYTFVIYFTSVLVMGWFVYVALLTSSEDF